MLRRWGLEPLILDQLPSENKTIIEKLEKHTADCHFVVVLATRALKVRKYNLYNQHLTQAPRRCSGG
ncbi:TIR domain-containing protein [Thiocystis violacea]|uniref:TIR domain-containing protein n=1 Tax=Thiocystis violacea TaxID=13725 RepID=UPI001F5BFDBB